MFPGQSWDDQTLSSRKIIINSQNAREEVFTAKAKESTRVDGKETRQGIRAVTSRDTWHDQGLLTWW